MKRRKVRFRERDSACLDRAGREYRILVDDYGNLENILEQVNEELEAHGLEIVLGDDPDYLPSASNVMQKFLASGGGF